MIISSEKIYGEYMRKKNDDKICRNRKWMNYSIIP